MAEHSADASLHALIELLSSVPGISTRSPRGNDGMLIFAVHERIVARIHTRADAAVCCDLRIKSQRFSLLCAIDGLLPSPGLTPGAWISARRAADLAKLHIELLIDEAAALARRR